jgi:hypothetical protein
MLTFSENIEHLENLTGPLEDFPKPKSEPGDSEIARQLRIPPSFVSLHWNDYLELYHTVTNLLNMERVSLVRTKHEIGKAIFSMKQKLIESGKAFNKHGHSGIISDFMQFLSSELRYSTSSLYHALDFYEKYLNWDTFADGYFDVKQKGVSKRIRISGKEANWSQVLSVLYPGKRSKSREGDDLCDYDRYGKYDCVGPMKSLKKIYHLCPTHMKRWEQRLTELEYAVGMLDEYDADLAGLNDEIVNDRRVSN